MVRPSCFALIALSAFAGCRKAPPAPPTPAPPLELAGCGALYADGLCARPTDGALRVFAPGGRAPVTARVGLSALTTETEVVPGGLLVRLVVPPVEGIRTLRVVVGGRVARFRIGPTEPPVTADQQAIEAALADATPARRGPLLSRLARLRLRAGDAPGAQQAQADAEQAHRSVGRSSAVAAALEAQIWMAINLEQRYALARALLDRYHRVAPDRFAQGAGQFLEGLLAWQTGDVVTALRRMEEAEATQRPIDARAKVVGAIEMQAVILRSVGRGDEALARAAGLLDLLPADDACGRARVRGNLGWVQTLERLRHGRGPDPRASLKAAHASFSGACDRAPARHNTALNLALAEWVMGDPQASRRWLARLPPSASAPIERWRLDIEGRLALAEGDPRAAEAAFTRLAERAGELAPEVRWRALVGQGDARLALGDAPGARDRWLAAEATLDGEALRMPLDSHRAGFYVDRGRSARRLVAHLVAEGRAAAGLCAARLARIRSLSALARRDRIAGLGPDARARWLEAIEGWTTARRSLEAARADAWTLDPTEQQAARAAHRAEEARMQAALARGLAVLDQGGARPTCADLRPPAPGELILAWAEGELPGGPRGLYGFAATTDGARAVAYDPQFDAADTAGVLAPFDAEIEAAHRIRIIDDHGLERQTGQGRVDLHAGRWRGRPLAFARPIAWALDVPRGSEADDTRSGALVVADPDGSLYAAQVEGQAVMQALRASGWTVESLVGFAATGPAVRAALPDAALLHYAGHGRASREDPWAAYLALADDGRLAVRDLLTLPRGPRWAVLSGCSTGLVDPRAAAGGMGLAQAFLLAGAEGVLAATEEVEDALAGALGAAVAARLGGPGAVDLPRAVHEARRALGERAGWQAFRVWVP